MNQRKFIILAVTAVVLLAAGVGLSTRRSNQQADLGGGKLFTDLQPALGEVNEVRLSKGDGSRVTLRKTSDGWMVVERQYPADAGRVREFVLGLVNLKIVEAKTSDPANYAKLGVENPDSPTATGTLVEVVAGKKSWSLIVGKGAEGRAVYVRKPAEKGSSLASPFLAVDPDQKRWIDRLLTDIPGASVHDISVKHAAGPAYVLSRAQRGATDLTLSPLPKGRTAVSAMALAGQADALVSFNFDDVRAVTTPVTPTEFATYRTFDGQVINFAGRRDGAKSFVAITASRDAALAAQFPPTAATASVAPTATPAGAPAPVTKPEAGSPADHTVERLATRAAGVEYEVPAYKYDAIFKPQEELLEKPAKPAKQ